MSSFGSITKSLLPHNQFICGGPDTFGTEECEITEGTLDMSKCVCKEVKESNLNLIEAYLLANEDAINNAPNRKSSICFRRNTKSFSL